MPIEEMSVLQPNYLGDELENVGLESMTANYGLGVPEVTRSNQQANEDQEKYSNPAMEKLRKHKAREFGLTKETVGF